MQLTEFPCTREVPEITCLLAQVFADLEFIKRKNEILKTEYNNIKRRSAFESFNAINFTKSIFILQFTFLALT